MNAKKITLSTVKSFIRKAGDSLLVSTKSRFDGMTDGCEACADKSFSPRRPSDYAQEHNLGIAGIWFVFGSRDHFWAYEDDKVQGIEVSNSCGRFILAVAK